MNEHITTDRANAVYTILVDHAGAREDERDNFVEYIRSPRNAHEWRFRGSLGLGGKLYSNGRGRLWVSCYPEDTTPDRKMTIERVNDRLRAMSS